jgi:hypothetical protein
LKYIYDTKKTSSYILERKFAYGRKDIREVLDYYEEKGYIIAKAKTLDGGIHLIRITSEGIDFIEGKKETDYIKPGTSAELEDYKIKAETISEKLESLEEKITIMTNRETRKNTYNVTMYSLLIATFLAILFNSFFEWINMGIPSSLQATLWGFYYFLILISILMLLVLIEKIRYVMGVSEFYISAKFDLGEKSQKEMVDDFKNIVLDKKLTENLNLKWKKIRPKFKGYLWNTLECFFKNLREPLTEKEKWLFKKYDELKRISFIFYNEKKENDTTTVLKFNFRENIFSMTHSRNFNYDVALALKSAISELGKKRYDFRNYVEEGY